MDVLEPSSRVLLTCLEDPLFTVDLLARFILREFGKDILLSAQGEMLGVSDVVVMEQERAYQTRAEHAHNYMGALAVPHCAGTISTVPPSFPLIFCRHVTMSIQSRFSV